MPIGLNMNGKDKKIACIYSAVVAAEIQLLKIFNFPQVTGKNFQMIIIILILFNYYTPKMIINIMILLSN